MCVFVDLSSEKCPQKMFVLFNQLVLFMLAEVPKGASAFFVLLLWKNHGRVCNISHPGLVRMMIGYKSVHTRVLFCRRYIGNF